MTTRKEQIEKAYLDCYNSGDASLVFVDSDSFIGGAEWADKNPSTDIEDQTILWNYISKGIELHYKDKIHSLQSQLKICVEALEFYACRSHEVSVWKDMPQEDWGVKPEEVDNGEIAKEALSKLSTETRGKE